MANSDTPNTDKLFRDIDKFAEKHGTTRKQVIRNATKNNWLHQNMASHESRWRDAAQKIRKYMADQSEKAEISP